MTEIVCNGQIPNTTEISSDQPQQEINDYVGHKMHIIMENGGNIKANKQAKQKPQHEKLCIYQYADTTAKQNKVKKTKVHRSKLLPIQHTRQS